MNTQKVIVAGGNVRNIAESAFKAGYDVIAVTRHLDADLTLYCGEVHYLRDERGEAEKQVEELAQRYDAPVVLSSGLEDAEINAEILGCEPKVSRDIVNKLRFYRKLERAGIPFPEILERADEIDESGEERFILKPVKGGGGEGIEFKNEPRDGYILQRYVTGTPCSVSLIAGREIIPIAANYILQGIRWLHAKPFQYCGNVTPFPDYKELYRIAIETASIFDLAGSFGIDFILADRPYVLEINPRFQGSLDSIEWACDINLFRLHVDAVEERRIEVNVKPRRYAGRAILFAPVDMRIRVVPAGNPFFADVTPSKDIEKGEPLVSILSSGKSRNEVLNRVREREKLYLGMQGVRGVQGIQGANGIQV
jgi:hypothetical protein